jgi:hypothetical protein
MALVQIRQPLQGQSSAGCVSWEQASVMDVGIHSATH